MKNSTKILLTIVAVFFTVFCFYTYSYINKNIKFIKTSVDSKKLKKENDFISININYPTIIGVTKKISLANLLIENDINKSIFSFENDAKDSLNEEIDLPKDIKSSISGGSSVQELNNRYVSILMQMEWYLRGAAHPSHSINTYIYDYKKERLVNIADLFKDNSNYLEVLSKLVKEDLKAQSEKSDSSYSYDESFVDYGASPKEENFKRILPTQNGLVIYFQEYEVSSYAEGERKVVIPYSKLKDIINTDSVIGSYVK